MNTFVSNGTKHSRSGQATTADRQQGRGLLSLWSRSAIALGMFAMAAGVGAQVNGVAQRPYLGWSSFSQQTLDPNFLTQANVVIQSDALLSSGLQAHGYNYINMDSGWHGGFDANGRPTPDPVLFPDIKALIDHIHQNGQKAGIYWIPGVEEPAVTANAPIFGTPYHIQDILTVPYTAGNAFGGPGTSPYHYKIDFTKPGAQAYIDSVVALFASWGVDFIKLDAVTPGSYSDDLHIDNRADVAAWSKAIANSGRPMWLTVSWEIDQDYLGVWQQFSNARRIDDDVECESRCATLTDWSRIYKRFRDLPGWQHAGGPALGWNDLDSLDIGDGELDGLSHAEKRSAMTLWAMANAPIYLGGDLTRIDAFGKQLATADEVLAVDQSGKPATQVLGGDLPVWISDLGDGNYYVALFNMNATPAVVTLPWRQIGLDGVRQVRDLWARAELGAPAGAFSTVLDGHGVRLLKVSARVGHAPPTPSTSYAATAATLAGSASIADCSGCSGGKKVGGLGLGTNNTVTFQNVYVRKAGVYLMQVDSMTFALRSYLYTVNGGAYQTLNSGGGSFSIPSSTTLPVCLKAGYNSIQFGNPTSYAPDLDRIVISGAGDAVLPQASTYEAEQASLGGTVTAGFSNYASGLSKAGNVGHGPANTVTFSNVTVPAAGNYQLEIDYATNGPRGLTVTVNNAAPVSLTVDGSTFDDPRPTLLRVALKAGTNTIQLGNPTGYGPDLDRIVVAPLIGAGLSDAAVSRMCPR